MTSKRYSKRGRTFSISCYSDGQGHSGETRGPPRSVASGQGGATDVLNSWAERKLRSQKTKEATSRHSEL